MVCCIAFKLNSTRGWLNKGKEARKLKNKTETESGKETKQLAVPSTLRKGGLSLAHESIMAGHLGNKKTLDRVLNHFAWPGVAGDVSRRVSE